MSTQPDNSPQRPIPAPAVDARAARTRRTRRVGRARAVLVSGAVVTSLVGTGAIVAVSANAAATTGSGTSTSSTSGSSNSASTQLLPGHQRQLEQQPRHHEWFVMDEPNLATRDWELWSTSCRLVVTDPAAMPAATALVDWLLGEIEAACSRFRDDSELMTLARETDGSATAEPPPRRADGRRPRGCARHRRSR